VAATARIPAAVARVHSPAQARDPARVGRCSDAARAEPVDPAPAAHRPAASARAVGPAVAAREIS